MQLTILSIAGKPGLYKLVSKGKSNLIVETLDEKHKRQPAFATDRVTSLADIAMYTDAEDVPLLQWYNILIGNGISDFEELMRPTEGDNIKDREEQE